MITSRYHPMADYKAEPKFSGGKPRPYGNDALGPDDVGGDNSRPYGDDGLEVDDSKFKRIRRSKNLYDNAKSALDNKRGMDRKTFNR